MSSATMPLRFETWENNFAARLGLGAVAVDYALTLGLEEI